jgi:hypothetical protein
VYWHEEEEEEEEEEKAGEEESVGSWQFLFGTEMWSSKLVCKPSIYIRQCHPEHLPPSGSKPEPWNKLRAVHHLVI